MTTQLACNLRFATIGYSARALTQACQAAGIEAISVDAFADWDCQKSATRAFKVTQWGNASDPAASQEIVRILSQFGKPCILLGGGTENWPSLVGLLHQRFHVLGPTQEQLTKLRSPSFWTEIGETAGIPVPEIIEPRQEISIFGPHSHSVEACWSPPEKRNHHSPTPDRPGNTPPDEWLLKPFGGAGGVAVCRWTAASSPPAVGRKAYYQRLIAGRVLGAHCILTDNSVQLLGITEALGPNDWPAPTEFIYRGSWGPIPQSEHPAHIDRILRLAEEVRKHTALLGWIQFDFVEDANGQLWFLEINPRWAAGMELLVDCGRANPVSKHLHAHGAMLSHPESGQTPATETTATTLEPCIAKAIYYAPHDIKLSDRLLNCLRQNSQIADIPPTTLQGQIVQQGHPLCTIKASIDATTAAKITWHERKLKLLKLLCEECKSFVAT